MDLLRVRVKPHPLLGLSAPRSPVVRRPWGGPTGTWGLIYTFPPHSSCWAQLRFGSIQVLFQWFSIQYLFHVGFDVKSASCAKLMRRRLFYRDIKHINIGEHGGPDRVREQKPIRARMWLIYGSQCVCYTYQPCSMRAWRGIKNVFPITAGDGPLCLMTNQRPAFCDVTCLVPARLTWNLKGGGTKTSTRYQVTPVSRRAGTV